MTSWKNRIIRHSMEDPNSLIPHPLNPRLHPKHQSSMIDGSLSELGWIDEIMCNERTRHILDGHERVKLAIENSEREVPVSWVDVTDDEEETILLTFNAVVIIASEDKDRVKKLIENSKISNSSLCDLAMRVAKRNRVNPIVDEKKNDSIDEVEEKDVGEKNLIGELIVKEKIGKVKKKVEEYEPIEFGVNDGDLWKVDDDTFVMCGDSTNENDLSYLLSMSKFGKIDTVITSPPYAEQRKNQYGGIKIEDYINWFYNVQDVIYRNMSDSGNFFLNIKPSVIDDGQRSLYVFELVISMAKKWGWKFIDEFCWIKTSIVPKHVVKHFKNGFEPVYQFTKSCNFNFYPDSVMKYSDAAIERGGVGTGATTWAGVQGTGGRYIPKDHGQGLAYPSNVIRTGSKKSYGHEATFPPTLVDFFVSAYSVAGDVIYDPFGGSGTTGVVANMNKRKSLMMEIQPKYMEIILNRFREECNKTAEKV